MQPLRMQVEAMSPPSSPSQSPVRQRCARCGLSLDNASLLLVCEHNLCLHCAAQSLEACETSGDKRHVAQCKVCGAVTEVDLAAATYLDSISPKRAPCSEGSTQLAAASALGSPALRTASYASNSSLTVPCSAEAQPLASISGTPFVPSEQKRAADRERPREFLWNRAMSSSELTSPMCSDLQKASERCGQCEEKAEVSCEQCEEVFCQSCAQSIHRWGRMARHRIKMLAMPTDQSLLATSQRNSPKRPAALPTHKLQPLGRTFHACPQHPQEPLNYFCDQCQSDCICAECCLHGAHQGHTVQCALKAAELLPRKVDDLAAALHTRQRSVNAQGNRILERRMEVAQALSDGRQALQAAIETASASLQKEEGRLLQEAEQSISMSLMPDREEVEGKLAETHRRLSASLHSGDAVRALTWFRVLKEALAEPPADAGQEVSKHLWALQGYFSEKCANLQKVAERLQSLHPELACEAMPPLRTPGVRTRATPGTRSPR
ncbi:unnamed protein product [Effrenium voratum]|nr:unnamed protein product [Effrenium voratum]